MKNHLPLAMILFICLMVNTAISQVQPDSSRLCRVETKEGNEFVGLMLSEDSVNVVLETKALGRVAIPRTSIKAITWLKQADLKPEKLVSGNQQTVRYFGAQNGYGLKKGEGYYQNIWVLWNQANYGITNYFSVGAGIIPIPVYGLTTEVYINPKFSIPVVKDKVNLGIGVIAGVELSEQKTGFIIVYGLSTFGSRNANVTLGLGYRRYSEGNWSPKPYMSLAGMARVGARTYLVTENYYYGITNWTFISAGGRSVLKKAWVDYGLFLSFTSQDVGYFPLPWIGFTVPFGK